MTEASIPITYARRIGLFSATMMVIGGIVGSGIFLNPAVVAARVHTGVLTIASWSLGAVIALIGAFVFAELGQRKPRAGGGYVYLHDAFGALIGFMYGWMLLLVMATGAIAAVAMTFASYLVPLLGWPETWRPVVAALAIVILTLINVRGVTPGAWTQNIFTVLKLLALAALIIAAFVGSAHAMARPVAATPPPSIVLAIGAALVPVLFAFGGWQQTNFVAEELRDPRRTLPRALVLGVLAVVVVYLLANVAYIRALGVAGLATSTAPASETMQRVAGPVGERLISVGIVASTFGFLNLVILVSPRVYQSMARDGLFFRGFARLHPTWRTPVAALALQCVWGVLLLASKTYGDLLDYVVFGDWIFFGLNAVALFVFRRRDGNSGVTALTPLHPWSTAVFILSAMYVMVGSIASKPVNAMWGTAILVAAIPVYLFWRRQGADRI